MGMLCVFSVYIFCPTTELLYATTPHPTRCWNAWYGVFAQVLHNQHIS